MKTIKNSGYINYYGKNVLSYLFSGLNMNIDFEIQNFNHDSLEIYHDQFSIGRDFVNVINNNIEGTCKNG